MALLLKILPFLKHKVWETRTAAALAISHIVTSVGVWEPPNYDSNLDTPYDASSISPLQGFDVASALSTGETLLASSGVGYESGGSTSNGNAKKDILATLDLNMPGAGLGDLGLDIDDELAITSKTASGTASSQGTPPIEHDSPKLSARERSMLKRKRKTGKAGSNGEPPTKLRVVDSPSSSTPSTKASTPVPVAVHATMETPSSLNKPGGGQIQPKAEEKPDTLPEAPDHLGDTWPFAKITDVLVTSLSSPLWEVRHGAALGLREVVKVQGAAAGMHIDHDAQVNAVAHKVWVENVACRILQILVLDRFGDFLGDQVSHCRVKSHAAF